MSYAETTSVSVEKTQGQIIALIHGAGAKEHALGAKSGNAYVMFKIHERKVRFELPLPDITDTRFSKTTSGRDRTRSSSVKAWEQACRSRWRALYLAIRAKLECVEIGITTFDEEFLAHIVSNNGQTIGQRIIPQLDQTRPSFQLEAQIR